MQLKNVELIRNPNGYYDYLQELFTNYEVRMKFMAPLHFYASGFLAPCELDLRSGRGIELSDKLEIPIPTNTTNVFSRSFE